MPNRNPGPAGHDLLPADGSVWGLREEAVPMARRLLRADAALDAAGVLNADELTSPEAVLSCGRYGDGEMFAREGGVAVIDVRGLILPSAGFYSLFSSYVCGLDLVRQALTQAMGDDSIESILLHVDSPGGRASMVPETAAAIAAARGQGKKIVASSNALAASAAYWIASQADEIAVTPSGEVGSIGVLIIHTEFSAMDEATGVTTTVIRAGRHKGEGNSYEPLTAEAQADYQAYADEVHGTFVEAVASGRSVAEQVVRRDFGEGRCIRAEAALSAGMVDRVETIEQTLAGMQGGTRAAPSSRRPRAADPKPSPTTSTQPPSGGDDAGRQAKRLAFVTSRTPQTP